MTGDGAGRGASWFANAHLLLVLAALCWGGNAVVGKVAAGVVSPIAVTFLRWVFGMLLIYLVARPYLREDWHRLRAAWLRVFLLGAFGFTAFNLCLYWALNYTSAVNVSIEQAGMPVLILLANFVLFGQRTRALQIVGVTLTMGGVLITATHGQPALLLDAALNRGDAIMLLAVALYGGYAVGLRFKPQMHWLSLLFGMSVAALIAATPFMAVEVALYGFEMPNATGWWVIAYTAVFPSLFAQLFFVRGVELIGPNRAGVFINLVPIFGAALAVVFLGEPLEGYHVAGLVLVLAGIALAERFGAR